MRTDKPNTTRAGGVVTVASIKLEGVTRNEINFQQECVEDNVKPNERYNEFPHYYSRLVGESPMSRACYGVWEKFLIGAGFTQEIRKLKVNDSENFNAVFRKVASDFALLRRYAVKINFEVTNAVFNPLSNKVDYTINPTGYEHLQAECCRWGLPNKEGEIETVVYNPYFNTSEEAQKRFWIEYPIFEPEELGECLELFLEKNKHYGGYGCTEEEFACVIFYNESDAVSRADSVYSRPDAWSAEKAMVCDALIWEFHNANLVNNGYSGGILTVVGNPDDVVEKDEKTGRVTKTLQDAVNEMLQSTFSGAGNAGRVAVMYVSGANPTFPKLESFSNGNDNDTRFLGLPEPLKEVITTAWGVPSILVNIQQAGKLGNTQEVELATKTMNATVADSQELLGEQFTFLLQYIGLPIECKIVPISPILELPLHIFDALTPAQKAEYIEKNYGIKAETQENATISNPPN